MPEVATIPPNFAKRKLRAGQPVLSPSLGTNSIPDNDTLEQLGLSGVIDVAWVEMESGPWTWRELSDISRVCEMCGITSLARVNWNEPALIGRILDRGIQSVLIPHVSTKADAERAVAGAFYAPIGSRSLGHPRQGYRLPIPDYFATANDEVMVVVLLEDMEAIRNLDEILAVDNIDCFYVAPLDLGASMGAQYLGRGFDPEVQSVVRDAVRRIVASGRCAGTAADARTIEDFLDLGVRFIRFSAMPFMLRGLQEFTQQVAGWASRKTP